MAPIVTLNGGTAVNEGGSLNYTYTWTDPGSDTWTHSIGCGTGGVASLDVFDGHEERIVHLHLGG